MERQVGDYYFAMDANSYLGRGSFATVYKGVNVITGEIVAVKIVEYSGRNSTDKKYLNQEIDLMKMIRHPNCVNLLHSELSGTQMILILEYCPDGDLKKYLDKCKGSVIHEDIARHFLCQLAAGFRYLNSLGIVHRDLKPQNILLIGDGMDATLKICDFGFSRIMEEVMYSFCGSPLYMAPEVLTGKPYTSKSDMWSVGCIFYEMVSGGKYPLNPPPGCSFPQLQDIAKTSDPIRIPTNISDFAADILNGLLQKNPEKRISWETFFNHPYLNPDNLQRSTNVLQNTRSTKKLKRGEAPSQNNDKWIQTIHLFYPHGSQITLYVKPQLAIEELKRFLANGATTPHSYEDILVLSANGEILDGKTTLGDEGYNITKKPLYVISRTMLTGQLECKPYVFTRDMTIIEESLAVLRGNALRFDIVQEKARNIIDHIKGNYMLTKELHNARDNQTKIYRVVRTFLNAQTSDLITQYDLVVRENEANTDMIMRQKDSFESSIRKLSGSIVPESLSNSSSKKVIDYLDNGHYTEKYERLKSQLSLNDFLLSSLYQEVPRVESHALEASKLREDITFGSHLQKLKQEMSDVYRKAREQLIQFFSAMQKNSNVDPSPFIESIIEYYNESETLLQEMSNIKTEETQALLELLHELGKAVLDVMEKRTQVSELQKNMELIKTEMNETAEVTKYAKGYDTCLHEVLNTICHLS
eukprot:TRINITY_DN306_c0_g1_i2.p1 TRINITY_DN306_c0_g1~~TRINITY_DN306_c0_g1_i2.p1  ORF type:complete len:700 (-),score=144.44 TRINITY_DN306_c0_g1_i2:369-2468(-)